jgi:hypothetical protein
MGKEKNYNLFFQKQKMNKKKFRENPTAYFFYQNQEFDNSTWKKAQAYANGLFETTNCTLCTKVYNLFENTPRILVQCGHTLCSECLAIFFKDNSIRCPLCLKLVTGVTSIEKVPVNHVIFSALTLKSKISQESSQMSQSHSDVMIQNSKSYDAYELECCEHHHNKVKHFFCIKHKLLCCRVCFQMVHK